MAELELETGVEPDIAGGGALDEVETLSLNGATEERVCVSREGPWLRLQRPGL